MQRPAGIVRLAILSAVLGLVVSGCATGKQTADPNRVLHVINRTTRTVGVEIGPHDFGGATYDSAVRPCSETTAVAGTQNVPSEGDLVVFLFVDPTRNFDTNLAKWSGDPVDLPGNYTALPFWSSGQTQASDLPRWLVIAPDRTSIESSAPSVTGECGPLVLNSDSPAPPTAP